MTGFTCDSCGTAVDLHADRCPGCGKAFDGVKCPRCGHQGAPAAFGDGCPKCGYLSRPPVARPSLFLPVMVVLLVLLAAAVGLAWALRGR